MKSEEKQQLQRTGSGEVGADNGLEHMSQDMSSSMHLFSKVLGHGEPVVILHGLFGSLNNWNTLSRELGAEFRVYLVDQRNHGRSPHDGIHTYTAMAEDLLGFFREEGIRSAHVIGHSMGGKTAMEFALSFPEAVRSLIVVDISPRQTRAQHDRIFRALAALHLDRFSSRESVDEALKGEIPERPVREFLLTNLRREENGRFAWKMNLGALQRNYGEINRAIENGRQFAGRVLFLKGGRSAYLTEEDIPAARALFPKAEFRSIPGAGHWVHAEAPGEFLDAVREFISS